MPSATTADSASEAALLARLTGDDEEDGHAAAVQIVTRYRSIIEEAAWHVFGTWDPAEDVAQDVSLEFLRSYRTVVVRKGLKQYLFHAGRTRALNLLRSEERAKRRGAGPCADEDTVENDGLMYLAADDMKQEVYRAIESMPERQREIFVLINRDRITRSEAAELLRVSLQTIDNNMWMANNTIRKCLAEGQWTRTWNTEDLAQITNTAWTLAERQHA
jgi:RNA polymerase sigma-70 factor (ECF subfamily)